MTDAIPGAAALPDDLREAFFAYERAILANDLDQLDHWFLRSDATLRGDDAGLLVGHDVISAFRGLRGGVAERVIEKIEFREITEDTAYIVSVSRFLIGGRGLQTQLWRKTDDGWRIAAAHVSGRPQPLNRTMWRTVGDPLFQGAWDGPLVGTSVAVKDLFAIKGYRIGAGNPAYVDSVAPEPRTAAAVTDLLRGGASLRGIARTDEFAYSIAGNNAHYGTPPNGALPGALPGGSSSGPASAVATGQADIGLATDTAGSIRVPSSYQGLWGLRTTHGLVPRAGLLPLAQSFDTVGWITRSGEVLQKVADWCLSFDGSGSTERVYGASGSDLPWSFRIPAEILEVVEPETRAAFEQFLSRLDAPVETVNIGSLAGYQEPFRTVQAAEAWRNNGEWIRENPGALGPAVEERFRDAARITDEQEREARAALAPLKEIIDGLLGDAQLLMPTVPGPAPMRTSDGQKVDAVRTATLRMTTPAAVAGAPALSIPLLTVPSQLGPAPVGVCVVSRAETDIALVRLGRRISDAVS
ncbi:AtzH-like domain-containing protein [Microbacterium amylolyticum]|uniref:Asp-tRNA(Asn)/Glu-tRNA(Gln) amidotransferase A subunit family amidase n=1 Tax=Microbacterium amylolyticum TaxID=936337 RepID=A0ABS4ZGR5_9MICO|nr:AtzH-like domain-containing protein [Microbacterium amylolyticum]MBP2436468.1 Asp-tRNA(Asn)/Glu-tRNA(Gln) amidotransferase A subunit family amidase [Microbacterium amylolyticum]